MRRLGRALSALLALALLVWLLFPLGYAVLTSLKAGTAVFQPLALPDGLALENYRAVFREQPFGRNILNSFVVSLAVVGLSLALGLTAALALGRFRFRGRRVLLFAVLSVSMFPQVAVLSGMFELVRWAGLYNSLGSLVLSYLVFTLPFTVWVLTAFVRELPRELEEAALLDGVGTGRMLLQVFLPLMAPAMLTTGLLAFVVAWNEFLFALTFTLSNEQRTVPVAIALISGGSQFEVPWGRIMAASVVVTVPLIVLVLVCQRRVVAGLTAGVGRG